MAPNFKEDAIISNESTPLVVAHPSKNNEPTESSKGRRTTDAASDAYSWARLLAFFVAAILTSGVIPGQNVYNRLFCEAGLFSYACQANGNGESNILMDDIGEDASVCCPAQWLFTADTMNILSTAIGVLFLAGGLIFDGLGGTYAALLGCALNATGFGLLTLLLWALPLLGPTVETTGFVVSILFIDAGMMITNMAFFGFLWHLPKHQALLLSLSNSCLNIAALIPVIFQRILRGSNLQLTTVLTFYVGMIVFVATPLCYWSIPSLEEYRAKAMEVLGLPIPKRGIKGGINGVFKLLSKSRDILLVHKDLHIRTIGTMAVFWMTSFVYMTLTDPLGQEIFRDVAGAGEKLATMYNEWNAALGFLVGPLVGIWIDSGSSGTTTSALVYVLYGILVSNIVIGVTCPIPSWDVQRINIVLACLGQIVTMLFMTRYGVLFAPPHRTGTVVGILVTVMMLLSLVPIIGMSVYIALFDSYTKPTSFFCFVASILLALYLRYLHQNNPWPSSPVLLPSDEHEISKTFGVGTLEDASFVAGMSKEKFRRLSSSSKISDQRELLNASLTKDAAERILQVSRRRRSSLIRDVGSWASKISDEEWSAPSPLPTDCNVPQPSIPSEDYEGFSIERGTGNTSIEAVVMSFNGNGGYGGRSEPSVEWIMSALGPPDEPKRIEVCESFFSPMLHCSEVYGNLLEVRVPNGNDSFEVAAVCCCYHPRGLEKGGAVMQVGSDRYYCSLASSGKAPVYLDRQRYGMTMLQRLVALKQDSHWESRREDYGPMWYVALLGTHPKHQGNGYGRKLLDLVASWAAEEGLDCYLECSGPNVPYYEKCGYEVQWKDTIEVEGDGTSMFGMARKCNQAP